MESPHPPYQAPPEPQPAAEEAAHIEVADTEADTPPNTVVDTPPDIEADTSPGTEADTPHDVAVDVDTDIVLGPPPRMDLSVTLIPPQHQPYQVLCPHLSFNQP